MRMRKHELQHKRLVKGISVVESLFNVSWLCAKRMCSFFHAKARTMVEHTYVWIQWLTEGCHKIILDVFDIILGII